MIEFRRIQDLTGQTGKWAALGCSGLYLTVLDCYELYWAILGCNGLHQTVMDCSEPCWAEKDFTVLYWAVLGSTGLF